CWRKSRAHCLQASSSWNPGFWRKHITAFCVRIPGPHIRIAPKWRSRSRAEILRAPGAGMAHRHVAQLAHARAAELAEARAQLVDEDAEHVSGPLLAERAEAPEEGLAGERRIGAERDRPRHIDAAAHAAVIDDRHALADRLGDRRQAIDRRRQSLDLPAAMIADDDAVEPQRGGLLRIFGMQHALHQQRLLPLVAIARDLVPGEGAPAFALLKRCRRLDAGLAVHVRHEIDETRNTVAQE